MTRARIVEIWYKSGKEENVVDIWWVQKRLGIVFFYVTIDKSDWRRIWRMKNGNTMFFWILIAKKWCIVILVQPLLETYTAELATADTDPNNYSQ